ncbi:hypothetical protein BV25DRAFT_1843688 [Artomyces pyxidatus]|uniref:Uncharacterized protein n=1 Tax=Artomyces pyxidatus TaxID=48021 RepID=A0ACB8SDS8_9AGAM|nr:hypothetical protein BV25DRAFT_1843688 [Artomyces pyxidatus]
MSDQPQSLTVVALGDGHSTFKGVRVDAMPSSSISTVSAILTRSILRASRQADYNTGYFSATELPECLWSDFKGPNGAWLRTPEKLGFDPYDLPVTITIVGRVSSLSLTDDLGLPLHHISSTFCPFYEADRRALFETLEIYSDSPGDSFPAHARTGDIHVDRYLPDDTSFDSALFEPFNTVFDGRAGYIPPGSGQNMPLLPARNVGLNDLAVYALTVERYFFLGLDGSWRWTPRLKLESITILCSVGGNTEAPAGSANDGGAMI